MALVILGVITLTFFAIRLVPGDPARIMEPPGTPESVLDITRQQRQGKRAFLFRPALGFRAIGGKDLLEAFQIHVTTPSVRARSASKPERLRRARTSSDSTAPTLTSSALATSALLSPS